MIFPYYIKKCQTLNFYNIQNPVKRLFLDIGYTHLKNEKPASCSKIALIDI